MATERYLALTASEFVEDRPLPPKIAWMACHFSPYSLGLCNLPTVLPAGSLLILNDRIPFRGQDPDRIAQQLLQAVTALDCTAVLLDFQQPDHTELAELAQLLVSALPCPVAVSESYAADLSCPVFLSPCPHHTPLQKHTAPWADRELWLDLARDAETITLTKAGAVILPLPFGVLPEACHRDERLHCHYSIENTTDSSRFTLWRTGEDLDALMQEAQALGIKTFVGLWQELRNM